MRPVPQPPADTSDPELTASGEAPSDPERFSIAGLTGVDIGLEIAGPGSRSYAFLIDWHIRLLLALAWLGAAWLFTHTAASGGRGLRPQLLVTVVPALVIYFLYHPVLEVLMRGRTPGKRMAGLRLVTRRGGTPSAGALLTRNIFRLIDCLPSLYLVGLACCFATAQRVRIGDMAAGTLLVVDTGASGTTLGELSTALDKTGLAPGVIELVHELLDRWTSLSSENRRDLALQLLGRIDPAPTDKPLASLRDPELRERLRRVLARGGQQRA